MAAPARQTTTASPDVAKLVTLHYRRRGWAWVAIGSAIGLLVYMGIGLDLSGKLTGTAEILSVIAVCVLLALALAGLVVVVVDTARIHRADAAVRASAKGSVSHYPVYAHAHRYPPRHHGSWVVAIIMLAGMTGIAAFLLPADVNSWGYVAGAEAHDTFHPVSYRLACSAVPRGGGCTTVTEGFLSSGGGAFTWGSQVPLGQPFSVREPLWAWGLGRNLTSGDGSAISAIITGLFFDAVALLLLFVLVVIVREEPLKQDARKLAPAGAHTAGASHPAPHPNRRQHGSGARRSSHRGRR